MLEIRDVTKIYRSKTGLEVKALDRVSVSFPETGMVFILGKSGSGKSTLLNVIGGLDSYDGGEFIIKGKSSEEFVGSDFDAYRNTFIGFIFQEYNILDDFSVGANIALALELQGKKATSEQIGGILSEVDLLDFAKRKPNELSGGQKQRVAIARALVKDPQIIMADEPTGALDSSTGKQILDTLKKLSEKKLVIIVSHDRDFAERYGDRIIEMKDGRIDSDVTKHAEEATLLSGGVHRMNDGILKIEAGYELTGEDLLRINEYLRAQEGEVYLSGDRRINDTVRTAAGITSDGKTSSFKDTKKDDVPVKSYEKKDSKFIRSSLPMKNAVKMGSSSLGHKKFRLVLTIFLSLIAFALFGFADTMGSYNKYVAATESIIDSGIKNASVTLGVQYKWIYGDEESTYFHYQNFNEDDILALEEKTGIKFLPVYTGGSADGWGGGISLQPSMISEAGIGSSTAYTGELSGVTSAKEADLLALGFTIHGKMPKTESEIAISKLTYETLNYTGFKNTELEESVKAGDLIFDEHDLQNPNNVLGKHLEVRHRSNYGTEAIKTYVVTAVIDTGFDYARYASFIPSDNDNVGPEEEGGILDMLLIEEMQNAISYGFHGIGYVSEGVIDAFAGAQGYQSDLMLGIGTNGYNFIFRSERAAENTDFKGEIGFDGVYYPVGDMEYHYYRVAKSDVLSSHIKAEYLGGRTSLGEKEYLLPMDVKNSLLNVGSVDFTEKVLAAAADAIGVETIDTAQGKYGNLTEYMNATVTRKYVNENRDAIKAEYLQYCEDNHVTPQPGHMLTSSNFFDEIWGVSGYGILPWEMIEKHKALATEGLFRGFFEALSGVAFHENIPDSFFENKMNAYFQLYFGAEKASVTLDSHRIADLLAEFEAAEAIYGGEIDYTGELFIDNAVARRHGVLSEEQREEWKNGMHSPEEATEIYMNYIRYTHYYENSGMEITENAIDKDGSMGRAIEAKALDLLIKASDVKIEDITDQVTLSSKVWEGDSEVERTFSGYTLAGFYTCATEGMNVHTMIISDGLYNTFIEYATENEFSYEVTAPHVPGKYAFVIAPMPTDKEKIDTLVSLTYDEESALAFQMQNPVMDTLDTFNDFIEEGAKIFMWIGVGFAVFSALMLMNFISVSISYKKREIGILRAVGAKSSDVYKIFFSESAIIALINYVLALVVTVAGTVIVNTLARNEGLNVTLLSFGIRQIILMLLISLLVAAVASFLPVYNIARKKPVDAIKDR